MENDCYGTFVMDSDKVKEAFVLSPFMNRIKKEWAYYGGSPEALPLIMDLDWLDRNSTYEKPLTGSCFKPIIKIVLGTTACGLHIPCHDRTFHTSAYLSVDDLHGAIITSDAGVQLSKVTCGGNPLMVNVLPAFFDDICYQVDAEYINGYFNELIIKGYTAEVYVKVKSFDGELSNITYSEMLGDSKGGKTIEATYDNIVGYTARHGLGSAKTLQEVQVTGEQKRQMVYIWQKHNNVSVENNVVLGNMYPLFKNCCSLIKLHQSVMMPYINSGKFKELEDILDSATVPFPVQLYTYLLKNKQWLLLEKALSLYHPKIVTSLLQNIISEDQTGLYSDMPPKVAGYVVWKALSCEKYQVTKYLSRWSGGNESCRFLRSTKPKVSSPLTNEIRVNY